MVAWALLGHLIAICFTGARITLALALGGLNEWENKLVDALPSAVA